MAQISAIEWTDATWNPVTGCTKISAGCDHCYAERFSERFRGVTGHPFEPGFDLTLRPERLSQPQQWSRPRLIFVNSMSDLFHKDIPARFVESVFDTMEDADWHIYQVLTKRSSLMRDFVNRRYPEGESPSHIWLGVSIESAATLSRLRHLKQTNASMRFVSFEPLLGPVGNIDLDGIHWAIAGGESGPGARPVDVQWIREIRDQCNAQGVAFFFKQWGGRTPKSGGNTLDGQKWLEYPDSTAGKWSNQRLQVAGSPNEPMGVGPWAQEKLECLRRYLSAYTTVLSKQRFKGYFYIDAFAGPGTLKVRQEEADASGQVSLLERTEYDEGEANYLAGSPRVALEIERQFTHYVFLELDQNRIAQLEELKKEFSSSTKIFIRKEDCNTYLQELLRRVRDWNHWRGIVFLDPFGMQVPWDTIAKIGATGAIEVIINFPLGMAVQRLLKRSGEFTAGEKRRLNEYFGTDEWMDLVYERQIDLAGERVNKVRSSGDILVRWYRQRLKAVFGYVSDAREIQSTSGRPLYYLIFAGPNRTGARIASHVLKQGARRVR